MNSPQIVQSASWLTVSWFVSELSSKQLKVCLIPKVLVTWPFVFEQCSLLFSNLITVDISLAVTINCAQMLNNNTRSKDDRKLGYIGSFMGQVLLGFRYQSISR